MQYSLIRASFLRELQHQDQRHEKANRTQAILPPMPLSSDSPTRVQASEAIIPSPSPRARAMRAREAQGQVPSLRRSGSFTRRKPVKVSKSLQRRKKTELHARDQQASVSDQQVRPGRVQSPERRP